MSWGGAAKASLELAAAGGVSVVESAELMSNAMNAFSLSGDKAAKVADTIAGAANASAININQFKFSLASVGAVAATIGFSFEDTATAIALLGQAGIKGSDAGTSLKTMFLNLSPSTKKATKEMRELGIITEDGRNQFFDAAGTVKTMPQVFEVLSRAMQGLTKEQQINRLQTIFGTDAIRASAIVARLSAGGFNEMAEAMGNVTAQQVADARLDNLAGSLEKLGGAWETVRIKFGQPFLPVLKRQVDLLTAALNAAEPSITAFGAKAAGTLDRIITRASAAGPAIMALGASALATGRGLVPLAQSYLPMVVAAFDRIKGLFGGAGGEIQDGIANALGTLQGAIAPLIPVTQAVGQAVVSITS